MRIQVFLFNSYPYSTQFLGLIMQLDIPLFHDPPFKRKILFYQLAYVLKLGLAWLNALAAKICLKLLDWKNHSIPMIRGSLEARSRRKDCRATENEDRETNMEGRAPFSTLLATFWFCTASKHQDSSAFRVTGAHECPQVNRWLVKTHLDCCSGQREFEL